MPGEQEQVNEYLLRFTMREGLKSLHNFVEFLARTREDIQYRLENKSGKVNFDVLRNNAHSMNTLDVSNIKDMERFDMLARKHKVQYAITRDESDPIANHLWFKASDESIIQNFFQDVLALHQELSIEEQVVEDVSEYVKEKQEENATRLTERDEEPKYTLSVDHEAFEEAEVVEFNKFEDLKLFIENTPDIFETEEPLSFDMENIASVNELKEALKELSEKNPRVKLEVQRKPILKEIDEKRKEMEREETQIEQVRFKEPEEMSR